jgi:hypothetical protein
MTKGAVNYINLIFKMHIIITRLKKPCLAPIKLDAAATEDALLETFEKKTDRKGDERGGNTRKI